MDGIAINGYQRYTVWAKRDDGTLTSLHENGPALNQLPYWVARGFPAAASVGVQGVSAVGWGSSEQRAFFVDEVNNRFVRYKLGAGCAVACVTTISPPTLSPGVYRVLTGHFVANVRRNGDGSYTEVLFATIKDTAQSALARLWVAEVNPTTGAATWLALQSGENFDVTKPLATTAGSDPAWPFKWPRVFAAYADGRIWVSRFNSTNPGLGWQGALIDRPNGNDPGMPMYVSAAAAEANVSGYRTYLFCTRNAPNDAHVYVLMASGEGSLTFSWQTAEVTAAAPSMSPYAVTATGITTVAGGRIDAFVLTSTQPTPALLWLTQQPGGALGDFQALPGDAETVMRRAGLVAAPTQVPVAGNAGYSSLFFLGPIGTAGRLYRQKGILYPYPTSNWTNHGPAIDRANLALGQRLTEGGTALLHGKAVHVAMQANGLMGADTAHRVQAFWSDDDGATWGGPAVVPLRDWETHHADPMVAFDDTGTAWITLLAGQRAGNCGNPVQHRIDYRTMTGPGALGQPVTIGGTQPAADFCPAQCGISCTTMPTLDHPWVAVDRLGTDRIHVVWTFRATDANCKLIPRLQHVTSTLPAPNLSNIHTIVLPWEGPFQDQGAGNLPVVSVGAQHATYVATGKGICRLDETTWDRCRGALAWDDTNDSATWANDFANIPGQTARIQMEEVFSIVASPSDPNKVYYAFQHRSFASQQLDVLVQPLTYVPAQEQFQPGVIVPLFDSDEGDQFLPVLSVSRDRTDTEYVFASWYDRAITANDPRRAVAPCNLANRCYRLMRAMSADQGLSFGVQRELQVSAANPLSDPANLPARCTNTNERFLGDYHNVSADVLHAFQVLVIAPTTGVLDTGDLLRFWVSAGNY